MNIPNLPTDNLYKFMALSGVILLVASVFFPLNLISKLNEEIVIYNGEIQKFNIGREVSINNQNTISDIEFDVKTIDLNTKGNIIENKKEVLETHGERSLCFIIPFSAIMAALGFALWYYKAQRYQDKILQEQAGELRSNNPNKNPAKHDV